MAVKKNQKKKVVKPTTVTHSEDSVLKTKSYPYKVEKGVSMSGVRKVLQDIDFPFALMEVGDSFLIPSKDSGAKKLNGIHYAARQYAKLKPGFAVTSRLQLDGARRVWRLK